MQKILIILLSVFFTGFGNLQDHFKKIENPEMACPIEGIDFVYLINLDHRTEKLDKSLRQLENYGICPYRFSAVNGWELSPIEINKLGLIFTDDMTKKHPVRYYPSNRETDGIKLPLDHGFIGKTIFGAQTSKGALGCTLSHLSILQHALEQQFDTILVLEDDIIVCQDPNILTQYMSFLDDEVGKENWDLLYTDPENHIAGTHIVWRPDSKNNQGYQIREDLSTDITKVIHRFRTHSMIIKRSGIIKILDYMKKNLIFLPFDNELSHIPNLNKYMLKKNIITIDRQRITDIAKKPPANNL